MFIKDFIKGELYLLLIVYGSLAAHKNYLSDYEIIATIPMVMVFSAAIVFPYTLYHTEKQRILSAINLKVHEVQESINESFGNNKNTIKSLTKRSNILFIMAQIPLVVQALIMNIYVDEFSDEVLFMLFFALTTIMILFITYYNHYKLISLGVNAKKYHEYEVALNKEATNKGPHPERTPWENFILIVGSIKKGQFPADGLSDDDQGRILFTSWLVLFMLSKVFMYAY